MKGRRKCYIVDEVAVQVVDYVGVRVFLHHFDLSDDQLFLRLVVKVHHLDSNHFARVVVMRLANSPRSPSNKDDDKHSIHISYKAIL